MDSVSTLNQLSVLSNNGNPYFKSLFYAIFELTLNGRNSIFLSYTQNKNNIIKMAFWLEGKWIIKRSIFKVEFYIKRMFNGLDHQKDLLMW